MGHFHIILIYHSISKRCIYLFMSKYLLYLFYRLSPLRSGPRKADVTRTSCALFNCSSCHSSPEFMWMHLFYT